MYGISLAAASGFRVFLPPFLLSIAVRADAVDVDLTNSSLEYFDSNVACNSPRSRYNSRTCSILCSMG